MPMQQGKTSLTAKLGDRLRKAHEKHKADDTDFGFMDLPAGIEGGVAQLVSCKFDVYKEGDNKGEFFFYAAGVVVSPTEHNGIRVAGLRTSITEPMCDTPTRSRKTVDEHVQFVYNELRKLGVDTTEMAFEDLEPTVKALEEAQPFFRFRTWKGQKQKTGPYKDREPRTQHTWGGWCDPPEGVEEATSQEAAVDEEVPSEPSPNGEASEPPRKAPSGGETQVATEEPEETDIESLVQRAMSEDVDAQNKLIDMASEAGASQKDIDGAEDWQAVADLFSKLGEAEEEPEEPEETPPAKGEVHLFKPKGAKKATQFEVVKVDDKGKTVDLKSLDTKKVFKDVPWESLDPES